MKKGFHYIKGKEIIVLGQSFIKNFIKKGELVSYCPYQIKRISIDKAYDISTESMQKGSYFESYAIGGTAKNEIVELPRQKNGKRYADHRRIDAQIHEFRKDAQKYQLDINRKTVQIKVARVINDWIPNVTIILEGTLDMLTYINYVTYHKAVIDLKLTKDVSTEKGDYCWGFPNEMDHLQAYMYHFMTGLPFYYMLYDYKAKCLEKKFLPIYIDKTHIAEMLETVRKAAAEVVECEMSGWKPRPGLMENIGFNRVVPKCGRCVVTDCQFYNNQNFIINKT